MEQSQSPHPEEYHCSQPITATVAPGSAPHALSPATDYPLYDPAFEHDACGTGFVANIDGTAAHRIVTLALEALANMAHRGAMDANADTSDGAGIMTQIPTRLINDWLTEQGETPIPAAQLALGMVFLPHDHAAADQIRATLAAALAKRDARLVAWRPVPVAMSALGTGALQTCPHIEQAVICGPEGTASDVFEQLLYIARKETEAHLAEQGITDLYFASLSARTVVYKGLLTAAHVASFYRDLDDPRFETALAILHQRYSTNTFPAWPLAQPMRFLAHNGEINTIQGNRNWMAVREKSVVAQHWHDDAVWLHPVIEPRGSDSSSLDNALELLARSGGDLLHALTLLAPEAWENRTDLDPALLAFFQAQALKMEPWDGPAALIFSDGRYVGATLDRNGLRPLRYVITDDGLIVLASEVGVVTLDDAHIVTKGRLGPGQMIVLDTEQGVLRDDHAVKAHLAAQHPYAEWVAQACIPVDGQQIADDAGATRAADLLPDQALFGYSHEDLELIIRPMVSESIEPVWSMGDDTPLSVLSTQPRPLTTYFKQRFAQVTNPPIDALREQMVMTLAAYVGPRADPLVEAAPTQTLLKLASPILDDAGLDALCVAAHERGLQPTQLATVYAVDDSDPRDTFAGAALQRALETLEAEAIAAVQDGCGVLVLSDRDIPAGQAPLPVPLAVSAVHHALIRAGLRLRVGLVAATGGAWDTHQIALLIGYGANAVCPYLALATARSLAGGRGFEEVTPAQIEHKYCKAIEKGLLKIMTRMGLSVLASYHGAQLFECIGLDPALVSRYFPGTPASFDGLTLADLHWQARNRRVAANQMAAAVAQTVAAPVEGESEASAAPVAARLRLTDHGYVRFRRNAEYHATNPQVVKALQKAATSTDRADYRAFTAQVYERPPAAIRDLLSFRERQTVPLDEVEPATSIVKRFITTAMSLGSLGPEAHLALTLGANLVGARSNTGEGGEDPISFTGMRDGISMNSRIKQIASGRFGVTAAYLAHAEEIEIKMAQGSKPGEGGQLPARKVTGIIARLRHTAPGVSLISPPPHHDIYSIEDLAQLIFDLKQVNPRAKIGVKLVAERGVGTIAAGVAKGHADYILISGHDGGTGASPLSSIKSVGSPWEMGLAEAQQVLRRNNLRGRVRLRTDGGIKTGRDVVVAALLGADEVAFGTAVLIALGCDMARQCHLDTCPAGIATQREDLRRKFTGKPEHVAAYLLAVADEAREIMAGLGVRTFDELVGRADLLVAPPVRDELVGLEDTPRATRMDLSALVAVASEDKPLRYMPPAVVATPSAILPEAQFLDANAELLDSGHGVLIHEKIANSQRTVGARLAGEIAWRYGDSGLPSGSITYRYAGSAGQSFGAFCVPGMRLILDGDANDYVAKGMTGGEIVIAPPAHAPFTAHEQVIAGNTVLYGATGGLLLVAGRAGERFAVRNSGAVAIVEGVGDHGCEYMTNGAVIVLGATGRNFGAGMSGGVAYVYDDGNHFPTRINPELVRAERINSTGEAEDLAVLLRHYVTMTGSVFAADLLATWPAGILHFWRVLPHTSAEAGQPLTPYIERLGLMAGVGAPIRLKVNGG